MGGGTGLRIMRGVIGWPIAAESTEAAEVWAVIVGGASYRVEIGRFATVHAVIEGVGRTHFRTVEEARAVFLIRALDRLRLAGDPIDLPNRPGALHLDFAVVGFDDGPEAFGAEMVPFQESRLPAHDPRKGRSSAATERAVQAAARQMRESRQRGGELGCDAAARRACNEEFNAFREKHGRDPRLKESPIDNTVISRLKRWLKE